MTSIFPTALGGPNFAYEGVEAQSKQTTVAQVLRATHRLVKDVKSGLISWVIESKYSS